MKQLLMKGDLYKMADYDLCHLPRLELIKRVEFYEKKYGPYIGKRGTHNLKNLFRKPSLLEWVIFIMLIMVLLMVWAYYRDITAYEKALVDCQLKCPSFYPLFQEKQSKIIFKEDFNQKGVG